MTVSYTGDVANASSFGCFTKILLKWRGSVCKLIYKELLAYIMLYIMVNLVYREVLVKNTECSNWEEHCKQWKKSRELFESLRTYCHEELSSIPLTFVLGFYVSLIIKRWWHQYMLLPAPDMVGLYTMGFITGREERQRIMRRSIIRYVLLSFCLTMRSVSFRVKKRFPDLDHLVDAGLLRQDEVKVMQELEEKGLTANKWFLPLVWATDICSKAVGEGRMSQEGARGLIGEIILFRRKLGDIIGYDWVSVPLVYTQVVTMAVYSYFLAALLGAQWIRPEDDDAYKDASGLPLGSAKAKLDLFYPFFLTIQFTFFFGWLKVAETLINPFGEDDDDFELNRIIDRHVQAGFLIADHQDCPELLQDKYWEESFPSKIPYTVGAEKYKKDEFLGSAENTLEIKDSEKIYGGVDSVYNSRMKGHKFRPDGDENNYYDPDFDFYESLGTPMTGRVSWLGKKLKRLGSVRSNSSFATFSTYIKGSRPPKLPLRLYENITKSINPFDPYKTTHQDKEFGGVVNEGFSLDDETRVAGFDNNDDKQPETKECQNIVIHKETVTADISSQD